MDELSVILLTVPIFFPMVIGLDFGMAQGVVAIWFGIMVLMTVGFGLLSPPVGLNVYVVNGMARDVPIGESYRGVVPFLISDVLRTLLLLFFPPLSLWLVQYVGLRVNRDRAVQRAAVSFARFLQTKGDRIMKRRSFVQGAAAAALGVPHLAGLAQQTVTLKFHTFMAPMSNVWLLMHKPWMEKVEKESGGRIKFEAYPAMQLGGTPVQLYDQARDGVVDIVWTLPRQHGRALPAHRGLRAAVHR